MSHILLVGPTTAATREYLDKHGHTYTQFLDIAQTKKQPHSTEVVVADFADEQAYLAAADDLNTHVHVDGIMTTYENSVLIAARVAKGLGLPGLPLNAAEACTDKFIMRRLFAKAPQKISPDYALVDSEADVRKFAAAHQFPLILKPANLAKSLLVTKNHDLDELLANYKRTVEQIDGIYARYAPHREPKILIEEFMQGSIHSVDAFVDSRGEPHVLDCVVDYQTGYDVGYDDNFHYSRLLPSVLPNTVQEEVKKVAELGCKALGIKNSPAHIEVIVTPEGPMIVEIGARNGGYRERMHRLANGIDLIGASLELALGHVPTITKERNDSCAVLELFPKHAGVFKGVAHQTEAQELPSFVQLNVKVDPGTKVGKSADGYKMCAMVMLHNEDRQQFANDLAFVTEQVHVELLD